MMKFKAIATVIFSAVLMFCLTACKASPKSADKSSSQPVAAVSSSVTTTSQTTTAVSFTTTATTTGTKRKTTTTTAVTTTAYAPITTTTSTATTTTVPEQTTTPAQTVATTAATTSAVTVVTTATTTTTPITTTTVAPVTASNVATTTGPWDYLPEGNMNDTLWAYANLAMYGEATDEIRQLITADLLNYATSKYQGLTIDSTLYANSMTDYNSSFQFGARNDHYRPPTWEELELYEEWGFDNTEYLNATISDFAIGFQEDLYGTIDAELDNWVDGVSYGECYVGFCYFYTEDSGYNVYQVSFIR